MRGTLKIVRLDWSSSTHYNGQFTALRRYTATIYLPTRWRLQV